MNKNRKVRICLTRTNPHDIEAFIAEARVGIIIIIIIIITIIIIIIIIICYWPITKQNFVKAAAVFMSYKSYVIL